jgi:hypothetical protein
LKKLLFVLLFSSLLVGCGSNEESIEVINANDPETEDLKDEMLESRIKAYMEQMTGKYILADTYENKSEQQQKLLNEALTEVNLATLEIEDEYNPDLPVVKDLNDLAESVSFAINELLSGEYSTKKENAVTIGGHVGDISRNYLDGELPPSIKGHTGKENAND